MRDDIPTLLRDAAADPRRTPDFDGLAARGRRQQLAGRAATVVMTVVALVVAGAVVWPGTNAVERMPPIGDQPTGPTSKGGEGGEIEGLPRPPDHAFADTVAEACPGSVRVESAFAGRIVAVEEGGPAPWVTFQVEAWFTDDLGTRVGLWAPEWDGQVGQRWLVAATRYQSGPLPSGDVITCESQPWTDPAQAAWETEWDGSVPPDSDTPESPADPQVLARLDAAEQRWQDAAPSDWTATITLIHGDSNEPECGHGPVRVVSRDGAVVEAIDLARDCAVPPAGAPTIDTLFDHARRVTGALQGDLHLDEEYGFVRHMDAHDRAVQISLGVTDFLPRALPLADDSGQALADARQRWEQAGIEDYRMVVDVQCFCPFSGPATVEVADGELVSVDPPDGAAEQDYGSLALTVDAIFDHIASTQTEGDVDVAYDPALGYPVSADLDPMPNAIDDEIAYRILELDPTP